MTAVFVHGVPDTPAMWEPLVGALAFEENAYSTLALPGFGTEVPAGFSSTKDAYLNWLIEALEAVYTASGPVDLVGHDWGALLCVRAAHQRPDLLQTWAVSNALPEPGYRWHKAARQWQTPVLGELVMALVTQSRLEQGLVDAGMPAALAAHEAPFMNKTMKRSILKLYRSAKTMPLDWGTDLSGLPGRGLVIWGDQDPYVDISIARQFCLRRGVDLHVEEGAGHWAVCERPERIAERLKRHWT